VSHAWIQTGSAHAFDFLECQAGQLQHYDLDEIAWCLAGEQRYAGHTRPRIMVAEHSVRVSRRVSQLTAGDVNARRCGLMHDAGEAYTRDLARPMKAFLRANGCTAYDELEEEIERQVAARFGLVWTPEIHALVKQADNEACAWEKANILGTGPREQDWAWVPALPADADVLRVWGWSPQDAYTRFMYEAEQVLGIK